MITRADVEAARARIAPHVRRTPLLQVEPMGGADIWLKCEFLQRCGVFKTRGAVNRQLAAQERGELDPAVGVVTASGGNAGLAHAFVAGQLGVPATVFVPTTAPQVKVDRLRAYGATVQQVGIEFAVANDAAQNFAAESGALYCHAYDQPEIVAGAGVIGLEILDDLPGVDTVVVAVGGGGLYAGVAAGLDGRAHVVAVEPELCPTLNSALAQGNPVDISPGGVAADSLGARRVGSIAFEVAQAMPPTSLLVGEQDIVDARHALWADFRIPSEHGAATAWAALTAGAYQPRAGERAAVIVCGANTDPRTLDPAPAPTDA